MKINAIVSVWKFLFILEVTGRLEVMSITSDQEVTQEHTSSHNVSSKLCSNSTRETRKKVNTLRTLVDRVEFFTANSLQFEMWLNRIELEFDTHQFMLNPGKERLRISKVRNHVTRNIWTYFSWSKLPRPKENIALFPAHRPGEKFLRCHPAANKNFFPSLFNNEISLCMYEWCMHYYISCFISHVSCCMNIFQPININIEYPFRLPFSQPI